MRSLQILSFRSESVPKVVGSVARVSELVPYHTILREPGMSAVFITRLNFHSAQSDNKVGGNIVIRNFDNTS